MQNYRLAAGFSGFLMTPSMPSVVLPRGGSSLKLILTVSNPHIQAVGHQRTHTGPGQSIEQDSRVRKVSAVA